MKVKCPACFGNGLIYTKFYAEDHDVEATHLAILRLFKDGFPVPQLKRVFEAGEVDRTLQRFIFGKGKQEGA